MFNIIAGYVPEADVLDLFAGTGSLGIEALSRGARSAVFIDRSPECFSVIKENLAHTKFSDRAEVIMGNAMDLLDKLAGEGRSFDIIFLDPPYNKNFLAEALNIIGSSGIIRDNGIVAAERDVDDAVPEKAGQLRLVRNQKYGDTILSFYKKEGMSN